MNYLCKRCTIVTEITASLLPKVLHCCYRKHCTFIYRNYCILSYRYQHDCSILGSVMVTAKKVILSSQGKSSQAVFGEIIVNAVSAIQVVTCQTVVDVISVLYRLSYRALGQNLFIFTNQPLFKGNHDRVSEAFPELGPILIGEVFVISLPFHLVEKADLFKRILSTGFVIFQRLCKLPSGVGPTSQGKYTFFLLVHFVHGIPVCLHGTTEVIQQGQGNILSP